MASLHISVAFSRSSAYENRASHSVAYRDILLLYGTRTMCNPQEQNVKFAVNEAIARQTPLPRLCASFMFTKLCPENPRHHNYNARKNENGSGTSTGLLCLTTRTNSNPTRQLIKATEAAWRGTLKVRNFWTWGNTSCAHLHEAKTTPKAAARGSILGSITTRATTAGTLPLPAHTPFLNSGCILRSLYGRKVASLRPSIKQLER